ncbi:hypothetical protein L1887_34824 [Cichorium endivia]|nr:hypothetical protein L1887_34824 [Cichorium endivia]
MFDMYNVDEEQERRRIYISEPEISGITKTQSIPRDVAIERQQYRTSANELISTKQELTNLNQDFDAALEARLAAFQQAADAQHAAKFNHEKEVDQMRETLHMQGETCFSESSQEHLNLIEEKDFRIQSTKKVRRDITLLRGESELRK